MSDNIRMKYAIRDLEDLGSELLEQAFSSGKNDCVDGGPYPYGNAVLVYAVQDYPPAPQPETVTVTGSGITINPMLEGRVDDLDEAMDKMDERIERLEKAKGRLKQKHQEKVNALLGEIEAWKLATGLEKGGDPDALVPDDLAAHLQELYSVVDELVWLVETADIPVVKRLTGRYKEIKSKVKKVRGD